MAKCPIGIGNCSFYYLYILGASIMKLLEDYLISLDDINKNYKYNLFTINTILKKHKIIKVLYKFLGFIIFGAIFTYASNKINEYKKSKKHKKGKISLDNSLIFNNYDFIESTIKEIIIVYILYSLQLLLRRIFAFFKLVSLDLWIFNIIFLIIFMKYHFEIKIYNHQKYSLIFIFLTNFLLLLGSTFIKTFHSINDRNKKINAYDYIKELFGNSFYFILIYLIYICLSFLLSLSRVYGKILMEIKYNSPYRIIFIIGIFGFILTLITIILITIFKCGSQTEFFCKVINGENKYFDSITIYFSNLKSQLKDSKRDFYIELFIIIPLLMFVSFYQFVFEMLIILYLNPIYILISDCLYFCLKKILNFIFEESSNSANFYINFIADIFALLGYFIYLEIIELKFGGLNKNIKKKIIQRGIIDSNENSIENKDTLNPILEEEDDQDINNTNNNKENDYKDKDNIDNNEDKDNDDKINDNDDM